MQAWWPKLAPILLMAGSNLFMTFAWYGHLKHKNIALPAVILVSWLIAGPEYMLAVPANRIGSQTYTTAELKTIQEGVTLIIFCLFSVFYLGEPLKATTLIGFGLIFVGAIFVFLNR
ncbi:MAG: DMT family protein [Caulobacteraceae bacterium]|nr:DMT family protein [Caulobacteraceae bacterium]